MEIWLLIIVLVIVLGAFYSAPYFRAVFEHSDRDSDIDNKVVTPPEENLSLEEEVREAEERGTLDEHGFTRE